MPHQPLLHIDAVSKTFPGPIHALSRVSFSVRKGEKLALLGDNGAGKTTLMNILYGHALPDGGRVTIEGKRLRLGSPRESLLQGIGCVHQEFQLAGHLTVFDNIAAVCPGFLLQRKKLLDRVRKLLNAFRFKLPLYRRVAALSKGEQQKVEILKSLIFTIKVLILDEPTTYLTDDEAADLFVFLTDLHKRGIATILITHKLREVFENAERVIVLSKGKVVHDQRTEETTPTDIAGHVVDESILIPARGDVPQRQMSGNVLHLRNLCLGQRLRNISFSLDRGRILTVLGIDGNGQGELVDILMARNKQYDGMARIQRQSLKGQSTARLRSRGIAYIPQDREHRGLLYGLSIGDNLLLPLLPGMGFSLLKHTSLRHRNSRILRLFALDVQKQDFTVGMLSGGNKQRLLVGRELELKPLLLIAHNMTSQLSMRYKKELLNRLMREKEGGLACLYFTASVEEALFVSDEILVLLNGRINARYVYPFPSAKTLNYNMKWQN